MRPRALVTDLLATMTDLSLLRLVVDKEDKLATYEVFEMAWKALIQRFENTMSRHNFPDPRNPDERGLLVCDRAEDKELTKLMR